MPTPTRRSGPPPSPRSIDPAIPEALDKIITRCIQPEAPARYATTAELIADLDALDDEGKPLPVTRRLTWKTGLAAAAVLASLVDGVVFVVDLKRSRRRDVFAALDLLERAGARVIAAGRNSDVLARGYADESRITTDIVDITDDDSIAALGERIGAVDHIAWTSGDSAPGYLGGGQLNTRLFA